MSGEDNCTGSFVVPWWKLSGSKCWRCVAAGKTLDIACRGVVLVVCHGHIVMELYDPVRELGEHGALCAQIMNNRECTSSVTVKRGCASWFLVTTVTRTA